GLIASGWRGCRRCGLAELALDPFELCLVALPDRALEPLPGGEHVPASEEDERAADHDDRVVEEVPVESRVPRDARIGERCEEHQRDETDPEDRQRVDPLVVAPEAPGAPLESLAGTQPQDD